MSAGKLLGSMACSTTIRAGFSSQSLQLPIVHIARDLKKPVALLGYCFNGGAPVETAIHTADGPKALWGTIAKPDELNIQYYQVVGPECATRNNEETHGVRNYQNVFSAITAMFNATASKILRGDKPVGIGGDHSMAAGSVRGSVLALAVKGILQTNVQHSFDETDAGGEKDPHLTLRNVGQFHKKEIVRALKNAAKCGNVKELCKILDYLIDKNILPIEDFKTFKNRFYVPWFDAHYDINTRVTYGSDIKPYVKEPKDGSGYFSIINSPSPSGNFHGMPVAYLAGSGPSKMTVGSKHLSINPANFCFFGVRDADRNEEIVVGQIGCTVYDMNYLNRNGIKYALKDFEDRSDKESIHQTGMPPLKHLQLDIDFLDATHVPLTGTPVGTGSKRNTNPGPSLEETSAALRGVLNSGHYVGGDIAELASCKNTDPDDTTIQSGKEMLFSLLNISESAEQKRSGFSK